MDDPVAFSPAPQEVNDMINGNQYITLMYGSGGGTNTSSVQYQVRSERDFRVMGHFEITSILKTLDAIYQVTNRDRIIFLEETMDCDWSKCPRGF